MGSQILSLSVEFCHSAPGACNARYRHQTRRRDWSARTPDCRFIAKGTIWSVRLLALRRRQCSAARNLGTKRVAVIALEQVRQLLRHAISHLAVDWLDGFAISTVENFLARRNTRLFALRMLGEAKQLMERVRPVLVRKLLARERQYAIRVWPHFSLSQRATKPPSAAVRQRSIALMTFICSRLIWPRLASRQAGPWSRKTSATSRPDRAIGRRYAA